MGEFREKKRVKPDTLWIIDTGMMYLCSVKYVALIVFVFLSASPLLAQNPAISYLMCDEAKSQLQIHGSFGADSGSVSIEDTALHIVSWSDSLIICNLPDSGKGAGGSVEVQTKNGVSNKRVLSIFMLKVDCPLWIFEANSNGGSWFCPYTKRWLVNWRMDISSRSQNLPVLLPFEASKSSHAYGMNADFQVPWHDTSDFFMPGFTFSGVVDLSKSTIYFHQEKCKYGSIDTVYMPLPIKFDATGYIAGYTDIEKGDPEGQHTKQKTDSMYGQKILFPPNPNVAFHSGETDVRMWMTGSVVTIQSENPPGPVTVSLYNIDGRLLKQKKLNISSPEIYIFDINSVHMHVAILILQTEKGVITREVIF